MKIAGVAHSQNESDVCSMRRFLSVTFGSTNRYLDAGRIRQNGSGHSSAGLVRTVIIAR